MGVSEPSDKRDFLSGSLEFLMPEDEPPSSAWGALGRLESDFLRASIGCRRCADLGLLSTTDADALREPAPSDRGGRMPRPCLQARRDSPAPPARFARPNPKPARTGAP